MKGPSVGALEMCCEEKEKETRTKDAFEFLTLTIFTTPAHVKQPATFFFFFFEKKKNGRSDCHPQSSLQLGDQLLLIDDDEHSSACVCVSNHFPTANFLLFFFSFYTFLLILRATHI